MSILYDWETKIHQSVDLAQEAVNTGDYTVLDIIRAQDYIKNVNPIAALRSSMPSGHRSVDFEHDLAGINLAGVRQSEENFNGFTEVVLKLQEDLNPDQEEWENIILGEIAKQKQKSNDLLDWMGQQAISIIKTLPETARAAAARLFQLGLSFVTDLLKKVGDQLKIMVQSVVDFIKGVWNSVVLATQLVKEWARTAADAIEGSLSRTRIEPATVIGITQILLAAAALIPAVIQVKEQNIPVPPDGLESKFRWVQCTIRNATQFRFHLMGTHDESGRYYTPPESIRPFSQMTFTCCNEDNSVLTGVSGGTSFQAALDGSHVLDVAIGWTCPAIGETKAGIVEASDAKAGYERAGSNGNSVFSNHTYRAGTEPGGTKPVKVRFYLSSVAGQDRCIYTIEQEIIGDNGVIQ